MKNLLLFITILLIQVTFSGSSNISNITKKTTKLITKSNVNFYLPKNVLPQSYIIRIEPLFEEKIFIGKNKIKVRVKIATNQIVLHCGKNINITSFSITNNRKSILLKSQYYNNETETYIFVFNDTLPIESISELTINYYGMLSNDTKGIYISSYWKYMNIFMSNETLMNFVGTHFQPTYARNAFPCFDEAWYKAVFTIIIRRPNLLTSLCNLPFDTTTRIDDNRASDIYKSDKAMSTYQITFFILELSCRYDTQFTLEICTRSQSLKYMAIALQIGVKARNFFSSFFNESNPLKLIKMVGVPNKTPEITTSFGLLIFNENSLLYDPAHTSNINIEKITTTIIRGWASMWFEHLVATEKSNYTWFQEAFAIYLSYYVAFQINLSLTSEQNIIIDQVHPALLEDGTGSSEPLTRKITTLKETKQLKDAIILSKGCSIVRMMHLILGTNVFNLALSNYVNSRKYKKTVPLEPWSSFQNSINHFSLKLPVNLKTIMNSWTTQPGYPVLHVTIKNSTVKLHQQRFFINNSNLISKNTTWWIPLTWASAKNPDFQNTSPKHWFCKKKEEINLNIDANDWVIFNVQQAGFYRVNYDLESWSRIIDGLYDESIEIIPPINRAMIIDDLFNLAKAGFDLYDIALDSILYISKEMEYLPIKAALNGLQYLYERFAGQEYSTLFNNFFLTMILPIYNNLNDLSQLKTPTNLSSMIFLQTEIDKWVCKLGYEKCNNIMLQHFHEWKKNSTYVIPKNQKSLVFCTAVKYGLLADIVDYYFSVNNLIEKEDTLESFKCIENKNLLESFLKIAIVNEKAFYVQKQQTISILKAVAQRDFESAEYILEFISINRKEVLEYFEDQQIIADIILTAAKVLTPPKSIKKLQDFINFNQIHFNLISDDLQMALNNVMFELEFYEKNHQKIVNWIHEHEFNISAKLLDHSKQVDFKNYEKKFTLANKNGENIFEALTLVQELFLTMDYYFFKLALNFIKYFNDKFCGRYVSEFFKSHIMIILKPAYEKLGFNEKPNESINDKLLRIDIVKWACWLENIDCIKTSRRLFDNWKLNSSALFPVSFRRTILCTSIKWGNHDDWIFLWNRYNKTNIPSERDVIRQALGCTRNHQIINSLLLLAITKDSGVQFQESLQIFSSVYSSGLNGVQQTLDFIFENKELIYNYYNNHSIIVSIFRDLSNHLTTRKLFRTYHKCVESYSQTYSKIDELLRKYLVKADNALLRFDDLSLQVFKFLHHMDFRNNSQLPKTIAPKKYDIDLIIDLNQENSHFDGFVTITLDVSRDTSYIVLHVANLNISSVITFFINDLVPFPLHNTFIKSNDRFIIVLNNTVEAGTQLLVCITYKGFFNNFPNVFYRNSFIDQNGLKHWLAATQVDKYGARNLIPCFDEPHFEAKIQLNIKRPNLYYSFTNMKVNPFEWHTDEDGVWDCYETNKPMSPYNISIIITDINFFMNYQDDLKIWLRSKLVTDKNVFYQSTSQSQSKADAGWVIVNLSQNGFYFLNFNLMTWENLFKTLNKDNFGGISVNDRAQIIDDLYNLANQDYISIGLFLTGTEYMIKEKDIIPWNIFLKSMLSLWNKFDNPKINDGLKTHVSKLMKPIYQYVGFESKKNDTRSIKELRVLILSWAIYFDYPDLINKSMTVFNKWRANIDEDSFENIIHSYEVTCSALKNGGFDEWKFVWQYTLTLKNNLSKLLLIRSLGCTYNEIAMNIYIRHIFSANNWIDGMLKKWAILSINYNLRNGFDMILNYLMDNHSKLNFSWSVFSSLLPHMTFYPLSASQLSKFMLILNHYKEKISGWNNDFDERLVELTKYVQWYTDHAIDVESWLIKKGYIASSAISINTTTHGI